MGLGSQFGTKLPAHCQPWRRNRPVVPPTTAEIQPTRGAGPTFFVRPLGRSFLPSLAPSFLLPSIPSRAEMTGPRPQTGKRMAVAWVAGPFSNSIASVALLGCVLGGREACRGLPCEGRLIGWQTDLPQYIRLPCGTSLRQHGARPGAGLQPAGLPPRTHPTRYILPTRSLHARQIWIADSVPAQFPHIHPTGKGVLSGLRLPGWQGMPSDMPCAGIRARLFPWLPSPGNGRRLAVRARERVPPRMHGARPADRYPRTADVCGALGRNAGRPPAPPACTRVQGR